MEGQRQGGRGRVLIAVPLLARRRQLLRPLTDAGFALAFNETGRFYDEPQLMAALGDAVAVLAGIEPYTERVLRTAPHLRVIARLEVDIVEPHAEAGDHPQVWGSTMSTSRRRAVMAWWWHSPRAPTTRRWPTTPWP